MRDLNEFEKDICKQIGENTGRSTFLSNIINDELTNIYIKATRIPLKAEMLILMELTGAEIESKIDDISYYILNVVNLIKLLEKENYILTINRVTQPSEDIIYGKKFTYNELEAIRYVLPDKNVVEFLIDFYDKEIYPTKELESFINRGYVSRNERRHKKQHSVSILALAVTTIAFTISTYLNILSLNTKNISSEYNQGHVEMSIKEDSLPVIQQKEAGNHKLIIK